jgi:hypothetical protein
MLYVTPRELRCGDWTIPLEQIRDALLFSFRGRFFRTAYVLRVDTGVTKYQFGLNGNAFWEGELPFPVRREHGRIGYSPLSVAARAVLLGYLAYRAWRWFA